MTPGRLDAPTPSTHTPRSIADRDETLDWVAAPCGLDDIGVTLIGPVLSATEGRSLAVLYDDEQRFRSTIDMARHRFGAGQYRYFEHPHLAAHRAGRRAYDSDQAGALRPNVANGSGGATHHDHARAPDHRG